MICIKLNVQCIYIFHNDWDNNCIKEVQQSICTTYDELFRYSMWYYLNYRHAAVSVVTVVLFV